MDPDYNKDGFTTEQISPFNPKLLNHDILNVPRISTKLETIGAIEYGEEDLEKMQKPLLTLKPMSSIKEIMDADDFRDL